VNVLTGPSSEQITFGFFTWVTFALFVSGWQLFLFA